MHPLAKKLLIARQLSLDDGEVVVLGDRALLVPFDIISGLEDIAPPDKIYGLGKKAGNEIAAHLKKMGLKSTKLGTFGHDLLSMSGWGKFNLLKMDKDSVVVHVENSITSKSFLCEGKKEKRCYFLAGLLSALWEISLDAKQFLANETKCMCSGSAVCEFIIKG